MNFIIYWVGYIVVVGGGILLTTAFLAFAATLLTKHMTTLHIAARHTYWWSRWIRWHRIARARKALRERQTTER